MFQLLPPDSAPGHPSPGTAREDAALAQTHGGLCSRGVGEEEQGGKDGKLHDVEGERREEVCLLYTDQILL